MALRRTCLYQNQIIGIESIYTSVNGKQINIEHKVEELRKLGREKKLFCPCGCGRNLIVVAGQKQLREQHFRMINEDESLPCDYTEDKYETDESIYSKIVLKCWLDEQLKDENLQSRVPISEEGTSSRKYEYSFLSDAHRIAVVYSRKIQNLPKEKIDLLQKHKGDKTILWITSMENFHLGGQYPENFMDILEHQGYCLGLFCEDFSYQKAQLHVIVFCRNYLGVYDEIEVAQDKLSAYTLNESRELCLNGKPVFHLKEEAVAAWAEKDRREREAEEERKQLEMEKKRLEEEHQKLLEEWKRKEEEKRRKQREAEKEARRTYRAVRGNMIVTEDPKPDDFTDPEIIVTSLKGEQYYRCRICGKIGKAMMFAEFDSRTAHTPSITERFRRG